MEQLKETSEISRRFAGWKAQVDLARQELKDWRERLGSRVARLREAGVLREVERLQNRFICQKEVADVLFHDLKRASRKASPEPDTLRGEDTWKERMETFRRLFEALRSDFEGFMVKIPA